MDMINYIKKCPQCGTEIDSMWLKLQGLNSLL